MLRIEIRGERYTYQLSEMPGRGKGGGGGLCEYAEPK